jgi:hypothetical protein
MLARLSVMCACAREYRACAQCQQSSGLAGMVAMLWSLFEAPFSVTRMFLQHRELSD